MPLPNLRISALVRRAFFCISDDSHSSPFSSSKKKLSLNPTPKTTDPTSDCPICFVPSKPHSFTCSNGHSTCDTCLVQILRRDPTRGSHTCSMCRVIDFIDRAGKDYLYCSVCDICAEGFTESEIKRFKARRKSLSTKRCVVFAHFRCRQKLHRDLNSKDFSVVCSAENKMRFGAHAVYHKPWNEWLSYSVCEK
ncbi:hypothetical protein TrLO_g13259 [Triparma laevis f. longispina]|uniref:RING-type domain-containing protein n=1 Tax=Triparma laevis f. longispina TaxID=1714387 RepID=A0A9W7EA32_9STRA|nr:hypothetical protein TrLO_g13259 [Triparma laevis f. longispina]